jgi:hypothetical protein
VRRRAVPCCAEAAAAAPAIDALWLASADVVLHIVGDDEGVGGGGGGGTAAAAAASLGVRWLPAGARGARSAAEVDGAAAAPPPEGAPPPLAERRRGPAQGGPNAAAAIAAWAAPRVAGELPPHGCAVLLADLREGVSHAVEVGAVSPSEAAPRARSPPQPLPPPQRPAALSLRAPSPTPAAARKPQWRMVHWKPRNGDAGRFPREVAHVVALTASQRPRREAPSPGSAGWGGAASPTPSAEARALIDAHAAAALEEALGRGARGGAGALAGAAGASVGGSSRL